MTDFPATLTVHWPTGPVNCCAEHAEKLVALGNFMGSHIAVTPADPDTECTNCRNESKEDSSMTDSYERLFIVAFCLFAAISVREFAAWAGVL